MTCGITGTRSSRASARRWTRTRCAASGSSFTNCRITSRARTRATITASIRTSRSTRPSPAWAPTSTCTTNGPASRWARSRTARASISASRTRRSAPIAASCARRSSRRGNGEKPLMVLDAQQAAAPSPGRPRSTASARAPTGRAIGKRAESRAQGNGLGQWALTSQSPHPMSSRKLVTHRPP